MSRAATLRPPRAGRQTAKEAYRRALEGRYGSAQAGLTAEYGKSWRCACEQDATLPCGPTLTECLKRHGRLMMARRPTARRPKRRLNRRHNHRRGGEAR